MRIALAYNAKPPERDAIRAARPELLVEEEDEPPSLDPEASEDLYAEWDDAETVLALASALESRHQVTLVEARHDFPLRIRAARPDLVFNIAEGFYGASREAQVPAILEMLGIPYTGSDPLTLALCLDKARAKEVLAYRGVPTAPFVVVEDAGELPLARQVPLPAMVKPLFEGSSKGIRDDQLVRDRASLEDRVHRILGTYRQPALVEAFLPGREFTVAILGNGAGLRVLPPVEIRFDVFPPGANPIYSWEAKWVWDRPEAPLKVFDCPARLNPEEAEAIDDLCRRTARVLRLRDWSRIDVRLDAAGVPNVLEVNPLPGVLPDPAANSCYPKAARAAGLDYAAMVLAVADAALGRLGWAP
ncbi:MAG: D-alanine--D-alanine ligase [Thermodesulfobacteriota bacterium]|jgi:D-alanine-D-alanine ligase